MALPGIHALVWHLKIEFALGTFPAKGPCTLERVVLWHEVDRMGGGHVMRQLSIDLVLS